VSDVPDFIPDDLVSGRVERPPKPENRGFAGEMDALGIEREQMLAEAVHRLRACGGTFVLITPIEEEHGGGFAAQLLVAGDRNDRVKAAINLSVALRDTYFRVAHILAQEVAMGMAMGFDPPAEGEDEA
jgi:hypothetical protein